MLNMIPVFGWLLSFILYTSMAIPFWILWTSCGLGGEYFYWLPERFHALPFWHTVGLFMLLSMLKAFSPFANPHYSYPKSSA
jgi:hypothetical protein